MSNIYPYQVQGGKFTWPEFPLTAPSSIQRPPSEPMHPFKPCYARCPIDFECDRCQMDYEHYSFIEDHLRKHPQP